MRNKLHRRKAAKAEKTARKHPPQTLPQSAEDLEAVYPIFFDFAESDDELILRTELEGVSDERHQLKVEPRRVQIMTLEKSWAGKGESSVGVEGHASQVLSLPIQVDPKVTTASLNCGLLELRMPRIHDSPEERAYLKAS